MWFIVFFAWTRELVRNRTESFATSVPNDRRVNADRTRGVESRTFLAKAERPLKEKKKKTRHTAIFTVRRGLRDLNFREPRDRVPTRRNALGRGQCRIKRGGEGHGSRALRFRGLTIIARWKDNIRCLSNDWTKKFYFAFNLIKHLIKIIN